MDTLAKLGKLKGKKGLTFIEKSSQLFKSKTPSKERKSEVTQRLKIFEGSFWKLDKISVGKVSVIYEIGRG